MIIGTEGRLGLIPYSFQNKTPQAAKANGFFPMWSFYFSTNLSE
jgi:hypothetical protein